MLLINNSPSITLSVASLSTEDIVSGSFISGKSFSDTESDTINFDSFQILGQDGSNFTPQEVVMEMVIEKNTDLSVVNMIILFMYKMNMDLELEVSKWSC